MPPRNSTRMPPRMSSGASGSSTRYHPYTGMRMRQPKLRASRTRADKGTRASTAATRFAPRAGGWQRFETHAARLQRQRRLRWQRRGLSTLLVACVLAGLGLQWGGALSSQLASLGMRWSYHQAPLASNPKLAAATSAVQTVQHFRLLQPVTVAIQAGHWRVAEHPPELSSLRYNTGGSAFGVDEVDINLAVARQIQRQLEPYGITVEILPATVPANYQADLFLALHADGIEDAAYRRGYKSSYSHAERNPLDPVLKRHIDRAYLSATRLPFDASNVQESMRDYFAFNRRYMHSLHPSTPALIVEMGYLTNRHDNAFLRDSKRPAAALAQGILSYLREQGRIAPAVAPADVMIDATLSEAKPSLASKP